MHSTFLSIAHHDSFSYLRMELEGQLIIDHVAQILITLQTCFIAVETDFNYSNSQSHTCIQDTSLTQDQGSSSQKYIFSERQFEVWPVSGGTANVIDTDEQVKVRGNRDFQNSDQIQTHLHCKFWSDSKKIFSLQLCISTRDRGVQTGKFCLFINSKLRSLESFQFAVTLRHQIYTANKYSKKQLATL